MAELTRRAFAALAAVWAAASAGAALAHPADELNGLLLGVMSVERIERPDGAFDVAIGVLMMNQTGEAATLRGVTAEVGVGAHVEQTVRVLGFETTRRPDFLRLDPGETRILQPPDGRILVERVHPDALAAPIFRVTLDFGPAGQPQIMARLEPAAPASDADPEPQADDAAE